MDFANAFQSLTQGMDEFSKKNKHRKSDMIANNMADNEVESFRERNLISVAFIVKASQNAKFSYKPIFAFAQLLSPPYNFSDDTLETISSLKYVAPMPVQAEILPLFYQGHHMLVSAPTGSGKTAAYLLPILNSIVSTGYCMKKNEEQDKNTNLKKQITHNISPFCIILSTTQELLCQIWTEAVSLGQKEFPKNGKIAILQRKHYRLRKNDMPQNQSVEDKKNKSRELRLPKDTKILITTPKRLATLITSTGKTCPINFNNLRWLVIDECDKMLETNINASQDKTLKAFRSQLTAVLTGIRDLSLPKSTFPTVSLFSATMPSQVVDWATEELSRECSTTRGFVKVQLGPINTASTSVRQELRYCGSEQGKLLELRKLLISGLSYPCLIFTESRNRADELFKEILLSDQQVLANILSGDKTEAQREGTVRAFREGKINVLICTDLLGRGMDFKGLTMVVNYDLPPSPTEYIHRVGRTGRAGRRGHSITLWTDADLPHLASILDVMKRSGKDAVDPELERLIGVWQAKKARQTHAKGLGGVISKRRGERRLVAKVAGIDRRKQDGVQIVGKRVSTKKQKQLLRPWNPNRGKISDVLGSIARDVKMGKTHPKKEKS